MNKKLIKMHKWFTESCLVFSAIFLVQRFYVWQPTDGWVPFIGITLLLLIGCFDGLIHNRHTDEIPNFIFGFMLGNIMMWTS